MVKIAGDSHDRSGQPVAERLPPIPAASPIPPASALPAASPIPSSTPHAGRSA